MPDDPADLEGMIADRLAEAIAGAGGAVPQDAMKPEGMMPTGLRPPSPAGMEAPVLDAGTPLLGQLPSSRVPAGSALPAGGAAPDLPRWLTTGDLRTTDAALVPKALVGGAYGDQSSIERLGRGFTRRDPLAGTAPLPEGRDAVTYSTAAVNTRHEAGQNWPDLVAFRASDRFPTADGHTPASAGPLPSSVQYLPVWGANRAHDLPAAALWPEPPPTGGPTRPRPTPLPGDVAPRSGAGATSPALPDAATALGWLADAAAPAVEPGPPWLADRSAGPGPEAMPVAAPDPPTATGLESASASSAVTAPPGSVGTDPVAAPGSASAWSGLHGVRAQFPALDQRVHGQPLVWLDNGATTQKPRAVIDAVSAFYERDNSNVHRGAHSLAARATDAYEGARAAVQRALGATSPEEIVFVRGTTEAINLVAQAWGRAHLEPGDEILVTHLEHHANIVPWQMVAKERGAWLRPIPVDDNGDVRMDAYSAMLSPRVKLVSLSQVSNTIGTVVPVAPMAAMAHAQGARVLVDGAQSVARMPVDVTCLGVDFFAFSGHKVYGPTGIGVLWGRRELLEAMEPWQGGGSMIKDVTFERTVYARPPAKFEAGTPHLAGAVGLGAALDWLDALGRPQVAAYEHALLEHMEQRLRAVRGLHVLGAPVLRAGAVSFVIDGHTPGDVAQHLDRAGIAVRSGHHCAQPILRRFGYEETVRASLGVYNVPEDIERLARALELLSRRGR